MRAPKDKLTQLVTRVKGIRLPVDKWPWIWASIAVVLTVSIASLGLALAASNRSGHADSKSSLTAREAKATADCVNKVLAIRAQYTEEDHASERLRVNEQKVAEKDKNAGSLALLVGKTRTEQLAGLILYRKGDSEFQQSLTDWLDRDAKITAKRAKHPLGRC